MVLSSIKRDHVLVSCLEKLDHKIRDDPMKKLRNNSHFLAVIFHDMKPGKICHLKMMEGENIFTKISKKSPIQA